MRNFLATIFITFISVIIYSQTVVNKYEYIFPNGSTHNSPLFGDFVLNESNEYYCTFSLLSHYENVGVVKLDSLGQIIWSKLLTGGLINEIDGITMASNGNFYVYGRVADDLNLFLIEMDPNGNVVFSKQFYVGFMESYSPYSPPSTLNLYSNGDALFAARRYGFLCFFRISPAGNIIWGKRISSDNSPVVPQLDGCVIMPNNDAYFSSNFSDSFGETTILGLNGNGDIIYDKTIKFGQWHSDVSSIIQWDATNMLLAGSIRELPTDDPKLFIAKLDVLSDSVVWVKTLNSIQGSVGNNKIFLNKADNSFHLSIPETSVFGSNSPRDFLIEFDSLGQTIRAYQEMHLEVFLGKAQITNARQTFVGVGGSIDTLHSPTKHFGSFVSLNLNSNFNCLLDSIFESTSPYAFPQEIPPPGFVIEPLDSSTVMSFQSSMAAFNIFDFCGYLESESNSYTEFTSTVVFPNPSTDMVNFYLPNCTSEEIRIMDSFGRVVFTEKIENESIELSVEHLNPGVYIYLIGNENTIYQKRGKFVVR